MDIEINDYEILDRANRFKDAVDILKMSNNLIPTELNACLACELYLKYLVNFVKDGIHTKSGTDTILKDTNQNPHYNRFVQNTAAISLWSFYNKSQKISCFTQAVALQQNILQHIRQGLFYLHLHFILLTLYHIQSKKQIAL